MKEWNDNDWSKFVVANDDNNDKLVIHLHKPRFIGVVNHQEEYSNDKPIPKKETSISIENPAFIDDPGVDVQALARLMREAGEFYAKQIGLERILEEGDEA